MAPSKISAAARMLGKRGGKHRSAALSPRRRRMIARLAALTRWSRPRQRQK
jgi:hypothetical protein